jgi:osmoprotectant transport system substrate-binding protein
MRRAVWVVAAVVLAVVTGGCGGSGDDGSTVDRAAPPKGPPIRIGSKNFTEQSILGELYRQALEAKGYEVVLKSKVGSTEIIHRALKRGALDMYPEYIGVLLSEVAMVRMRPRSAAAAYERAKAYEQKSGYTLLEQTPFSDSNALAVKPRFAARHRLRTIADLRRVPGRVRIAALPEFRTRFEGLVGLRDVYRLHDLRVVPLDSAGRYRAVENGTADVASVFTTEGQLAGKEYVVLADERRLFASGHVAPLISQKVLAEHGPRLEAAIDDVTRSLTTPAMREMNAQVDLNGRDPAAVAAAFLRVRGLAEQ